LRRCIYYDIPFPQKPRLTDIILSRLNHFKGNLSWLEEALSLFFELRDPSSGLEKKPSTAELLDWLTFIHKNHKDVALSLRQSEKLASLTMNILFKTPADRRSGRIILERWWKKGPARQG
jgi:MoxR-like ATPase